MTIELSKSEKLCEEISKISDSTCFLGFSRGKDSVAAWLRLKKYFKRIIPFHSSSIPGLSFVDRSLEYYERFFDTPIERFGSGEVQEGLNKGWYSAIEDEDLIDSIGFWKFDKHDMVDCLREKYNLPNAWCAYGINASDSLDRRIYVNKYEGRIDSQKSFYPCYDMKKDAIIQMVIDSGARLADDYLIANRTIADMFTFRGLETMMEKMPEDFEKVETFFPFIRASIARNKFRIMNQEAAGLKQEAVEDGEQEAQVE